MKRNLAVATLKKIAVATAFFWLFDFLMHYTGVGETNFYYASKFGNALLFSIIWFGVLEGPSRIRQLLYSFAFGTYISFYYLIASYSGLVQFFFGVYARYTAPPFVIFGVFLPPFLWWIFHAAAFYAGVALANLLVQERE